MHGNFGQSLRGFNATDTSDLEYGIDSLPAQEDKDKLGRMLMIPFERKKQRSLGDRQKWDSPEFLCPLLFGILANPTT